MHEAGHALLALLKPGIQDLDSVTTKARRLYITPTSYSNIGGTTSFSPRTTPTPPSREEEINSVMTCLAGSYAEKNIFENDDRYQYKFTEDISDFIKARKKTRAIIEKWGIPESKPFSRKTIQEDGMRPSLSNLFKSLIPTTKNPTKARVRKRKATNALFKELENQTLQLLKTHKTELIHLAEALLASPDQTLSAQEAKTIIGIEPFPLNNNQQSEPN